MSVIEMIQRCVRHGSPRGLGVPWHEPVPRHDEEDCQRVSDEALREAAQTPNLLVWNGRSHLLAIELKEDASAPSSRPARRSGPRTAAAGRG